MPAGFPDLYLSVNARAAKGDAGDGYRRRVGAKCAFVAVLRERVFLIRSHLRHLQQSDDPAERGSAPIGFRSTRRRLNPRE